MAGRPVMKNKILDTIEERLADLAAGHVVEGPSTAPRDMVAALELLLQALRSSKEALDANVAERLGVVLCGILTRHSQLPWAVCSGALRSLQELIHASDLPTGVSRKILGPILWDKVLIPLAEELNQDAVTWRQYGVAAQETFLQDFQEQWLAFTADSSESTSSPFFRSDLTEPGVETETAGSPAAGRSRCARVLFAAHRIATGLASSVASKMPLAEMPGLDEVEKEELLRFQPGVPVHIGKMNRVKCFAHGPSPGLEREAVYLLPTQSTLLLVRPDDQKPFWAVPVVVEPLRLVRLAPGDENGGQPVSPNSAGSRERPWLLNLEVSSPRSPALLNQIHPPFGFGDALGTGSLAITSSGYGAPDMLSQTVPGPIGGAGAAPVDLMAHSLPAIPRYRTEAAEGPLSFSLSFSDERRRRVAWKVITQARHHVCQRLFEGVTDFLADVECGKQRQCGDNHD
eukprot:TRINITY_DN6694_c1_g2_i1.p1 TRINITY_DN6694_c1_g2~~TRINITY_DN6694_c1_g2_i1.p1  ORF type:complete len:466 (+),score=77.25 TRINITY_DN6694_c1_g2_i1:27-1400(+)